MYSFIQHILNGLAAGTVYALVALGYTMVYGVLKLINFAHGDVMMVGVYVGYAVAFLLGRDVLGAWWVALLVFAVAMGFCALLVTLSAIDIKTRIVPNRVPLVPFLSLGAVVALFFGERVLESYLGLF